MRQKTRRFVLAGWLVLAAFIRPAWAEEAAGQVEKTWSFELGADRSNLYLFRGVDLLDGEAVLWPHAKWTLGNWAVSYFGYYGDLAAGARYQEHDFSLDYTVALGDKVKVTAGAVTYLYNRDAEETLGFFDTWEWYALVAFDLPLAPTIAWYRDVDAVDGGYASLAVSQGFPLGEKVRLNLAGSAGFDFHYNNKAAGNGTFNDVLFSADLPVQLTERFRIHAMVQRSFAQKALQDLGDGERFGDQTVITVGAALTL
jgi:hypothetical protein